MLVGELWGLGWDHVGLLVVQGEELLVQLLLVEDEGDIQQGVLHEALEVHLVEIQVAHLVDGDPCLGIQDMDLAVGDLWVELVA